ncbi:hypothetical protein RCL1_005093 [Eukaryota sp. TZLM3-RCL]
MSRPHKFTLMYDNVTFSVTTSVLTEGCSYFRTFFALQWDPEYGDVFEVPHFEVVNVSCFRNFMDYISSKIVSLCADNSYPLHFLGWHFGCTQLVEMALAKIQSNIRKFDWFKTISRQVALNNDAVFMEHITKWMEPMFPPIELSSVDALSNSIVVQGFRDRRFLQNMFDDLKLLQSFKSLEPESVPSLHQLLHENFKNVDRLLLVCDLFTYKFAIIQNWPDQTFILSLNRSSFGRRIATNTIDSCSIERLPNVSPSCCVFSLHPFALLYFCDLSGISVRNFHFLRINLTINLYKSSNEFELETIFFDCTQSFTRNRNSVFQLKELELYTFSSVK